MFNAKSKSDGLTEKAPSGSGSASLIGAGTSMKGDISGQQADIMGTVTGTIKVKELLQLRSNCSVNGNLQSTKLQIEPSASFNGQCHMLTEDVKPNGKASQESKKEVISQTPAIAMS